MSPTTTSMLLEAGELDSDLARRAARLARLQTDQRSRAELATKTVTPRRSDVWGEAEGLGFYDPTFVPTKAPGGSIPLVPALPQNLVISGQPHYAPAEAEIDASPSSVRSLRSSSISATNVTNVTKVTLLESVFTPLVTSGTATPQPATAPLSTPFKMDASPELTSSPTSLSSQTTERAPSLSTRRSPSLNYSATFSKREPSHHHGFHDRQEKRQPSRLRQFFSLKEPSAMALAELQASQAEDIRRRGGIVAVPTGKLPKHVPKVNSRWDGMPESHGRESSKGRDYHRRTPSNLMSPSKTHSSRPSVCSVATTLTPLSLAEKGSTAVRVTMVPSPEPVTEFLTSALSPTIKREDAAPWEYQDAPVTEKEVAVVTGLTPRIGRIKSGVFFGRK